MFPHFCGVALKTKVPAEIPAGYSESAYKMHTIFACTGINIVPFPKR